MDIIESVSPREKFDALFLMLKRYCVSPGCSPEDGEVIAQPVLALAFNEPDAGICILSLGYGMHERERAGVLETSVVTVKKRRQRLVKRFSTVIGDHE